MKYFIIESLFTSPLKKCLMEKINEDFDDRTENLDKHHSCMQIKSSYYMKITGYKPLFVCMMAL